MAYVVLLKTGYYLSKNNRTQVDIQVAEMEKATKYGTKQEASSALRLYKQVSGDVSMSGVLRKFK